MVFSLFQPCRATCYNHILLPTALVASGLFSRCYGSRSAQCRLGRPKVRQDVHVISLKVEAGKDLKRPAAFIRFLILGGYLLQSEVPRLFSIVSDMTLQLGDHISMPGQPRTSFLSWQGEAGGRQKALFSRPSVVEVRPNGYLPLVQMRCKVRCNLNISQGRALGTNFYWLSQSLGDGYGNQQTVFIGPAHPISK